MSNTEIATHEIRIASGSKILILRGDGLRRADWEVVRDRLHHAVVADDWPVVLAVPTEVDVYWVEFPPAPPEGAKSEVVMPSG